MRSSWILSQLAALSCLAQASPLLPFGEQPYDSSVNHSEPVRGVNIGGWLVLEPYITPSLFERFRLSEDSDEGIPVDEYHFCAKLGLEAAEAVLKTHWDTFYMETDFKQIRAMGFNLVRIPVGYWAFSRLANDPYVSGVQEKYLDLAIGWAKKHNLKVWIDLHGAAGSQNGFDNSGLRDQINFLNYDENVEVTLRSIKYLLAKYSGEQFADTVTGIELLNEPLGPAIDMGKLKSAYLQPSYDYLRSTLQNNDQTIVIQDAFQPPHYWDSFINTSSANIIIDHHYYQVFSQGDLARGTPERVSVACGWGQSTLNEFHPSVAGEFSAALTDCAQWLNGVGIGSRYDGSFWKNGQGSYFIGTCEGDADIAEWSETRKQDTRRYLEAQIDSFERTGGWIIWCYKTESSIEWSTQLLAKYGMFPQPITSRQYLPQCS